MAAQSAWRHVVQRMYGWMRWRADQLYYILEVIDVEVGLRKHVVQRICG
jgi:hypothetical protein